MDKKTYYREYRKNHIAAIRKTSREWARKNPQPYIWSDKKRATQQRYRLKHKEKIAEKRRIAFRKKLKEDINFKLNWLLRGRVMRAMKMQLADKAYKTIELIGCSIQEAREHIEKQFTSEMSWDNNGKIWEIDHYMPIVSFDLTIKEEQKKAFHYTNMRPLIKWDNRSKGSKIPTG